jgi:hypothetical protein
MSAVSPKADKAKLTRMTLTGQFLEFSEKFLAVCLTLGLGREECLQPKPCLGHIKSAAFAAGNEALHFRDMLVSFSDVLFDS